MLCSANKSASPMMTLQPHPHIKEVRSEFDEYSAITIVMTDLIMSEHVAGYDKAAVAELTRHVEAWQVETHDRRFIIEGPA
jgi:hypothetical protein